MLGVARLAFTHDGRRHTLASDAAACGEAVAGLGASFAGEGARFAAAAFANVGLVAPRTLATRFAPTHCGLAGAAEVEPEDARVARRTNEALYVDAAGRSGGRLATPHVAARPDQIGGLGFARDRAEVGLTSCDAACRELEKAGSFEVEVSGLVARVARLEERGLAIGLARGHHASAPHVEPAEELGDRLAIVTAGDNRVAGVARDAAIRLGDRTTVR